MKRSTGHHQPNRRLGKASQQASASVQARALFKADTDCFPLSVFRVGIASGQEHPIVGVAFTCWYQIFLGPSKGITLSHSAFQEKVTYPG